MECAKETFSYCCRCSHPCCLGSQTLLSAANSWISSDPNPCVCVKGCVVTKPPHSNYQTIRGGKRSEEKTSLTCHYRSLAAVCYPIVTNNLFNFASNVFLASFKHNDWGVKFSSQLCKYGMILLAVWCYFAFGSWFLPLKARQSIRSQYFFA